MSGHVKIPLALLQRIHKDLAEYNSEVGGCDHNIGICVCGINNDLEILNDIISQAETEFQRRPPDWKGILAQIERPERMP